MLVIFNLCMGVWGIFGEQVSPLWWLATRVNGLFTRVNFSSMLTLMSLQADIDSLHSKCNELRQSFGHPTTLESEARALVKDGGSRPGTEQALLQLRDSKASELQLLSLRCCGRSTRDCHGAVTGPSGSRFNLKLLLAVADCMSTQGKELAEHTKRHEALQRENRALRELTGQHSAAEGGSAAFPASPVPSAAALVRPSSAMAAVRRQPPPVPCDGRPSPREAFAELFGSSSSSVSASVSGNVSGSGSGSGSSGIGSNQPSGVSRKPPPQPAPPAVSLKNAPPALALQRPPPPSTAAVRQPDAPSHRPPPALRRDASGPSLTAAAAATAAAANAADAAAAAALTAEVSARASSNGSRELRLLSLQRRLDESLAENAMWKRQFAKRLDERLAEMTGAAGGAPASNTAPAPAPTAPTANAPNTAPPIKPPPAAAPGPAPPSAPAPKAHIQPLQPSKGAQDGAAAAVASATAADALAASAAEAERLRTELQAALVRARAAETGRDADKQRSAKLDAELKEAHASLEKAKAALASYASADASAKQRSAGEADASKAAASKAQGAAAQAESRAQQLEQRAEKAASQQAAMHAEQAAAAAKAKAELSADLSATRESLATAERELSETRRAAERAEVRASKAEREAERVAVEARRVRDEALASAQAQASDDL